MTRIKAGMKRIGNQETGVGEQKSEGPWLFLPSGSCLLSPDSW